MVFRDKDMLKIDRESDCGPKLVGKFEGTYVFAGLHSCSGDLHWPSNDI